MRGHTKHFRKGTKYNGCYPFPTLFSEVNPSAVIPFPVKISDHERGINVSKYVNLIPHNRIIAFPNRNHLQIPMDMKVRKIHRRNTNPYRVSEKKNF